MSTPDFNKVWGSNSSLTPYEFSDSEYLKGWESVGATPPARTQFDALQRNNDLKAQYLKDGLDEVKAAVQDDTREPSTEYAVGTIIANKDLPATFYLKCKVGGTSSDTSLVVPSDIEEGDTITDGTVVWEAFRLASNDDLQTFAVSSKKALAESTGYGIVSGCEPSINGLTVTVGAGVVHLADGTRKELSATNITLDNADSSNPRIDLVYIDSTGEVAKVTGTAAASPSAPTLPTGGISVCNVSVAANATAGDFIKNALLKYNTATNAQSLANRQLYSSLDKFRDKLGVCSHTLTEDAIVAVKNIGITKIRTDAKWDICESTRNVYDYSVYVNYANLCDRYGITPLFILGYQNTLYGDGYPCGIITNEQRTGFVNYATGLVTAMVNAGHAGLSYELWNEPNSAPFWEPQNTVDDEYTKLAKLIYPALKNIDPTCKIITHSLIASWQSFLYGTFERGISKYTDAISIHPYGNLNPESEHWQKYYSMLRSIRKGSNIGVVITEYGWSIAPVTDSMVISDELRAKYITREILYGILNNNSTTYIYKDYCMENSTTRVNDWYGLLRRDGTLTQAAIAVKNLARALFDYAYVGPYYLSDSAYILQFVGQNGNMIYVGWTTESTETITVNGHNINLSDAPEVLDVIDDDVPVLSKGIKTTFANYDAGYNNIVSGEDNQLFAENSLLIGYRNTGIAGTPDAANLPVCAIGRNNASCGTGAFASGQYCKAMCGDISEISTSDITNNTVQVNNLNHNGFATNDTLYAIGKWSNHVDIVHVQSIVGNVITLVEKISTSWEYLIKNNPAKSSSLAMGSANISAGHSTLTTGTLNIGASDYSILTGNDNITSDDAYCCIVLGHNNTAKYESCLVGGYYSNVFSEQNKKPLIVMGNGNSQAKSNAFRVTSAGDVYGLSAYNSSGADYAEYFEWADGNAGADDRVGYFVTFDSDKRIKLANANDHYILGIVSGNPATLGNSYNDQWQDMYVTDDFGRIQYEDVEVEDVTDSEGNIIIPAHTETRMKINPDYDNTKEYIGRENRKEWSAVGMLGVLPVRDDGTCEVNGYCKVANGGIATKATSGYRVIERVSDNVVKIVFR